MPISATFQADFTAFTTAVTVAQTKLVSFEGDAKKVANSLSAMEKSISGVPIMQAATIAAEAVERLGGVSKLTYAELQRLGGTAQEAVEKMQALGQAVPKGIQDLADQARGAAEETLRLGDATKTAADNTSGWGSAISTLAGTFGALTLQRVIDEVIKLGTEAFNAADKLQQFSDRTDVNVETLQRLEAVGKQSGVSLETLVNGMTTLQRKIGEGSPATIKALDDLGIKLADIKKLKPEDQYFAVAAALKDLTNQSEKAAIGSKLMGNGFAESLPAIKKGFDDTKDRMEAWSQSTVKTLADAKQGWGNFWDVVKGGAGQVLADVLTGTTEGMRRLADEVNRLPAVATPEKFDNMWAHILPPGLPKDLDDFIAKSDALGKALDAQVPALAEIADLTKDWKTAVEELDPLTVALAKNALAHGASQKTVVDAYQLSAGAVKEFAAQMKEAADIQKVWKDFEKESHDQFIRHTKEEEDAKKKGTDAMNATVIAGLNQIQAAQAAAADAAAKATLSSTDYQLLKVKQAAEAQIAAFKGTAEQAKVFAEQVMSDAARLSKAIIDAAANALDVVAKKGMDAMAILNLAANQAQKGLAVDVVGNAQTAGYGRSGMQSPIYVAPPIFARAAGGPVTSGQPYMVGEKGPELFVPSTSGGIVPNGRAGIVQNIVIHVNGTAADVARQVSDEIMRAAMRGQQFGAS